MKTLSPTNEDRADWANLALDVFRRISRCDTEDMLGDLLCDLMHWAEANDYDFDAALIRARGHYEAEVRE